MTTKHSPTPWHWDTDSYRKSDGVITAYPYTVCRVARTNQEANAAFIVRAVNAYEDMRKALTEIADQAERATLVDSRHQRLLHQVVGVIAKEAKAALALTEEAPNA